MNDKPIDKAKTELAQWREALTTAFNKASFTTSFHELSGCRMGDLHVRRDGDESDTLYKVEFTSTILTTGQWPNVVRTVHCLVGVYNPSGKRKQHVKFSTFNETNVAKIVNYAAMTIDKKLADELRVDAKRERTRKARTIWAESKVELPDWMSAEPNAESDADVGTFYVLFSEHNSNYGLKRLTPEQIGKIARYIQAVIEPMPAPLK